MKKQLCVKSVVYIIINKVFLTKKISILWSIFKKQSLLKYICSKKIKLFVILTL